MSARLLAGTLLVCASLTAVTSAAQPAPPPTAQTDAWMEEGIRLRAERRDAEALAVFRRAWEAARSPEARAQMALAEQALGLWIDAERDLLAALAAADHPWIARNRGALDAPRWRRSADTSAPWRSARPSPGPASGSTRRSRCPCRSRRRCAW